MSYQPPQPESFVGTRPQQGGAQQPPRRQFVLASFGQRVLGTLYDALLFLPVWIAYGIATYFLVTSIDQNSDAAVLLLVIVVVALYLVNFALQLFNIRRQGITGSTFGQQWAGIAVVREADARPLGFGMAFLRLLAHTVDYYSLYIGYLWPLWDSKRQTFADKICHTVVIRTK